MKKIDKLLDNITEVSKISFKIFNEKGDIYTSPNFHIKTTFVESKFKLLSEVVSLMVCSEDKNTLPLLQNYIVNRVKQEVSSRNDCIKQLIEGKKVSKGEILDKYAFLSNSFALIVIKMNKNLDDVLELLEDSYGEENITLVNYNDEIFILGKLEDIKDHVYSIKDTIEYATREKCLIYYTMVESYENLYDALIRCRKKVEIAKKFNISNEIIEESDLIFEDIVDSINNEKKQELIKEFEKGFLNLDKEMTKTIEVFFDCGLNISEAAKILYIHRNTLIYRLEKIQKCSGFDIRDFNQATIFKILFFIWKEEKIKK